MNGPQVPAVFVPRYTSFVLPGSYPMPPVNVEVYGKARVTVWRGLMPGSGTRTCTVVVEDSHDADAWRVLGSVDPGADASDTLQADLTRRWLRVRVEVEGPADTGVSCWVVGTLEVRVDGGGEA